MYSVETKDWEVKDVEKIRTCSCTDLHFYDITVKKLQACYCRYQQAGRKEEHIT